LLTIRRAGDRQHTLDAHGPYVLRELFCSGCGLLIDAQAVRPDDPVQYDTRLSLAAQVPSLAG
jgi:hypothetical protein